MGDKSGKKGLTLHQSENYYENMDENSELTILVWLIMWIRLYWFDFIG